MAYRRMDAGFLVHSAICGSHSQIAQLQNNPTSIMNASKPTPATTASNTRVWSEDEHDRFLAGLKMHPRGPWKLIADQVGTRSPRQVQTHAQKYYEKVERRLRGLRKDRIKVVRVEHRIDQDIVNFCKFVESNETGSGKSLCSFMARARSRIAATNSEERAPQTDSPTLWTHL